MKNLKIKYLLLGFGVLAAIYILRLRNAAKGLFFAVGAIRSFKISKGVISFVQNIDITNPYFTSIPVQSIQVIVYLNSIGIGTGYLLDNTSIKGKDITSMPMLVQVPLTNLLSNGIDLYNSFLGRKIALNFVGEISSLGFNFPFNETFKIDLSKF
jgi:hypothetical protein